MAKNAGFRLANEYDKYAYSFPLFIYPTYGIYVKRGKK